MIRTIRDNESDHYGDRQIVQQILLNGKKRFRSPCKLEVIN